MNMLKQMLVFQNTTKIIQNNFTYDAMHWTKFLLHLCFHILSHLKPFGNEKYSDKGAY